MNLNLRQKIKRLIEESPTYDDASKLICVMLNYELELEGNGWFEDDPELEALFEDSENPKIQNVHTELSDKIESILAS